MTCLQLICLPPLVGVDNVLQATVVLPNASHITTNAYQNTDIFWALRGGGGPSFGVATSITYKTHPELPYTGAYYVGSANSTEAYIELLTAWSKYHNAISDAGWVGVWPFFENTLYLTFTSQGTSPPGSAANTTFEEFFTASRKIPGVNVSVALTAQYSTYYEFFYDNMVDSSKGFGINYADLVSAGTRSSSPSWILSRDSTAPEHASALGNIFANITVGIGLCVSC